MKTLIALIMILVFTSLVGCNDSSKSCYDTEAEAWQACNSKYNGKCKYLGSSYKVCANLNMVAQPIAYTADCSTYMDNDDDRIPTMNFKITVNNNIVTKGGFDDAAGSIIANFERKDHDWFVYCSECEKNGEDSYNSFHIYLGEVKDGRVKYRDSNDRLSDGSIGTCILR